MGAWEVELVADDGIMPQLDALEGVRDAMAWQSGALSGVLGVGRHANPYRAGTRQALAWLDGYVAGRESPWAAPPHPRGGDKPSSRPAEAPASPASGGPSEAWNERGRDGTRRPKDPVTDLGHSTVEELVEAARQPRRARPVKTWRVLLQNPALNYTTVTTARTAHSAVQRAVRELFGDTARLVRAASGMLDEVWDAEANVALATGVRVKVTEER